MKCIAIRDCQARVNGKIRTFNKDDIFNFDKCPEYFRPVNDVPVVESGDVDYENMSESWLMEHNGNLDEFKAFLEEKYPESNISENTSWAEAVKEFFTAKALRVTKVDNTGKETSITLKEKAGLESRSIKKSKKEASSTPKLAPAEEKLELTMEVEVVDGKANVDKELEEFLK